MQSLSALKNGIGVLCFLRGLFDVELNAPFF